MNKIALWVFAPILALMLTTAGAATFTGRVVGVHDGDTITVLDANHHQHKIRLAGIDSPEMKQAYGNRSKQNLSNWVYNRQVTVDWNKRDRYSRTVGVVFVDGQDVNLEQVRAGMAWWYRQYAKEQSPDDRKLYELAENEARNEKLGLWADAVQVPPWEWRRGRR
jgi:endonuclease YncB( thermonuclease family)